MKKILMSAAILAMTAVAAVAQTGYPYSPVPFTSVKVTDTFWGQRLQASRDVTIPLAFSKCEETDRYKNFDDAAKQLRTGVVTPIKEGTLSFDDTDVYKTIEGASYLLQTYDDPKLKAYIDSVLVIVAAAQEPDGYLNTFRTMNPEHPHNWMGPKRWSKVEDLSHELYNLGHMVEGAVAHYTATGKRNFLDIAIRYADCVCREIGDGEGQEAHVPGHQIAEMALAKLYVLTKDQKYLDMAKYFLDKRGYVGPRRNRSEYSQSHKPILEQDEAVGHAVRATYMYTGIADVAALTGDKEYFEAIDGIWDNVVGKKMYVTGGVGSTGSGEAFGKNYELPNMSAYCETCAAIAMVYWNQRMFLLHGESKYIDVLERSLYNGVLSGISLDGGGFFYPNPLESIGQHQRQAWFGCACCPSNACRFIPSVPGYAYAVKDNNLYVNLYMANDAKIKVGKKTISLSQKTNYPWSGDIDVTVNTAATFNMKLRIPGWAQNQVVPSDLYFFADGKKTGYKVYVNGQEVEAELDHGYVNVNRKWKKGDKVTVSLEMTPRVIRANSKVIEDNGKVAISNGPIVYCAEWPDNNFAFRNTIFNQKPEFNVEYKDAHIKAGGNEYGMNLITTDIQTVGFDDKGQLKTETHKLTLQPYYAWAHRGNGEMCVWFAQDLTATTAVPPVSKTTGAKIGGTIRSGRSALNDRLKPKGDEDRTPPYCHWWPKQGGTEWMSYTFAEPVTVSSCTLYWFEDQPWGGCGLPESWKIYYKNDAGEWVPVKNTSDYKVTARIGDRVEFETVTTKELKLEVNQPGRLSCGIYEWEVE
ncbi:MAG: glycoside hydrolase family 127 protein [Bacteroidales bacterium]|nr:glycoside hydrolase family 127 protein [Bacteroidales bacterium]